MEGSPARAPGDTNPLLLTTRQLVRVSVVDSRRVELDQRQELTYSC